MTAPGSPVERLADHVVSLETTVADEGPGSLQPLADVFEGRSVVGLGEATHGTREFFELKRQLVELLVTELDFRLFGLEAGLPETLAIDDYVVSGAGDPVEALEGLGYWTWRTEEMLALIEWLREYNEGRPAAEKVRFYGFDMQFTRGAAQALRTLLDRVDPDGLARIDADLRKLAAGQPPEDPEAIKEWLIATETVATELDERFERHAGRYRSVLSDREWRLARRRRRVVEQAHEFVAARAFEGAKTPNGVRDRAMAENVSWILDHEDAERIALWAHNGHVAAGTFQTGDRERPPRTMGSHLRRTFEADYFALGFEFGRGSFRALPDPGAVADPQVRTFEFDSIREGTLPAILDALGESRHYLDVESARADRAVSEWLEDEHLLHNVGAVAFDDADRAYRQFDLSTAFDGLVYISETRQTVPVGEG